MPTEKTTRQVAMELGLRPSTLNRAVYEGRVPAPPKSSAGNYLWRPKDVEAAMEIFGGSGAAPARK